MAEIALNLWAYLDADSGLIYSISGRAYCMAGDDEHKLGLLQALSVSDSLSSPKHAIPDRFQVQFSDGTTKQAVTFPSAIRDPNAGLFTELMAMLEEDLPPVMAFRGEEVEQRKQIIPETPVCAITILYENATGEIRPIVTAKDLEWVKREEALRGRVF